MGVIIYNTDDEEITGSISVVRDSLTFKISDDIFFQDGQYVRVRVTNSNGTVVSEGNTDTSVHTWIPSEIGEYTILYTSYIGAIQTGSFTFSIIDAIDIKPVTCGKYTIENTSLTNDLIVRVIDPISLDIVVQPITILKGESALVSIGEPGIFSMVSSMVYTGAVEKQTLLTTLCIVEDCISDAILELLCPIEDACNPCPDETDLNRMLLLSYSYFMSLNSEFATNTYYTGLDAAKLSDIATIQSLKDKLMALCKRTKCVESSIITGVTYNPPCPTCY